jgi:hypothetical protein
MRPLATAMIQDDRIVAPGVFQFLTQEGQVREMSTVVDPPGRGDDAGREPVGRDAGGAEGVAKDVTKQESGNLVPAPVLSHLLITEGIAHDHARIYDFGGGPRSGGCSKLIVIG